VVKLAHGWTRSSIRQLAADKVVLGYGDVSLIARGYGVSPAAVHMIITGKTWRDV
jgi:hypothetical protein